PTEAVVVGTQVVQSAGAANALHGGQQPQGHENLRVGRGPSGSSGDGTNALAEGGQVESLNELPNGAGVVFGSQQVVQGHGRDEEFPVGAAETRLRWGGRGRTAGVGAGPAVEV